MRRYAFAEQDGPLIEAQQIATDQAGEVSVRCCYPSTSARRAKAHPSKPDRSRTNVAAAWQTDHPTIT